MSTSPPSQDSPAKVTVIIQTYNHEKWIAQAIDSVLMQETNFEYEVVIVEDCSTDSTRDIVLGFHQKHPDKIRLVLSEKNKESHRNFAAAFVASQSEYIAWLDGDDYWTSPHKLQKQVDFLDAHPECAICFHNITHLYEDGSQELRYRDDDPPKKISTIEDLLVINPIPSPSPMLRGGLIDKFSDWYYASPVEDRVIYALCARYGDIGYINENMATYRIHSGGAWSKLSKTEQIETQLEFYKSIDADLYSRYKEVIDKQVSKRYKLLVRKKAQELEEHLSKQEAKDTKVWSALQKASLLSGDPTTASVEFVDVSSWEPEPEEGRWLAWQLQVLLHENRKLQKKHQQKARRLRKLRKHAQRLHQQLQAIQGSRSWNLLRRFGHLRGEVSGRLRG